MIPLKKIENARHIVLVCEKEYFPQASILYSYLLTLHKKVSLFSLVSDSRYSFLPWYDKLRSNEIISFDIKVDANVEILELFDFFKKHNIKINKKIATAFYAGFLERYENFLDPKGDGTLFAILSELLASGAEQKLCISALQQRIPLSRFRLQSIIYKKFLLKKNAQLVYVCLNDADFEASGASWDEVYFIAKELLNLVNVQQVLIKKSNEKNKIINLIKEV